jgi:hypothetical protein
MNETTNQPTKQLTEGRRPERRRKSMPLGRLDIPALTASLGTVTDTLNFNWDCAYANEFPVAAEDPDVGKLSTTAQRAIYLIRGHNFGWKAED